MLKIFISCGTRKHVSEWKGKNQHGVSFPFILSNTSVIFCLFVFGNAHILYPSAPLSFSSSFFFYIQQRLIFYFMTHLFQLTVLMNKDVTLITQSLVVNVAWWTQTMRHFILCVGILYCMCCMHTLCVCVNESYPISVCLHEPFLNKDNFAFLILFTVVNSESCDFWWWQWVPGEECIVDGEKDLQK